MINVALQAELDRQVFLIRKSFEFQDDETKGTIKGLSWQMAGTQDMANGNKIPFYWPDVRNLTKENSVSTKPGSIEVTFIPVPFKSILIP